MGKPINPQLENIAPNFSTCLRPSGSLLKQNFTMTTAAKTYTKPAITVNHKFQVGICDLST